MGDNGVQFPAHSGTEINDGFISLCGLELFLIPVYFLIFSSTSDRIFDAEKLSAFAS